ncbi:hypothetical protein AJ85_04000 [Alkalihalobacillus alcalophilus ATCC 27647 = CGMCC 1.3604]|uniref:Cxxc_20_cxxc protein n=1 Tax=Alkalihalobacillus alcalophilus ATCC 27647 = CGMCC 1.3604 TaxID=1218173 RepID=A0A094XHY3_ALKAL|nr:TIGR04104 family putative zinc finger protein [Alkalihalobacillus alcalophilus]KGA98390.1 hypothetical protein BALCAV_0204730 [Alkalihalobacillus alcalophilus ATCC 27647 = CGMCC 1.3604]MED1563924.1 hypothetical protein [Alkalihalobacillus alcalophilus]THG91625.1 hypothetical protein AJ85_04000 [Alkalihalobacillus alcalophilus ATCC 27647 = CGMCC 1.3604]
MKKAKCWNCGHLFKWSQLFIFYDRKSCTKCKKNQFLTAEASQRILGLILLTLPLTIIALLISTQLELSISYYALVYIFMLYAIRPFLLEFTNEKQHPLKYLFKQEDKDGS